jgi:hypothetical protein
MNIDVIIRSQSYSDSLGKVIDSICLASNITPHFIVVNTGSTAFPSEKLTGHCRSVEVINYIKPFSYSGSLNIAIPLIKSDYFLVLSSHTFLLNQSAIRYAVNLLEKDLSLAAVTFADIEMGELRYQSIDAQSFTGFNGCWNTACLYRSNLVKKRAFNEVVFTAEDLEWSRWAIEQEKMRIAHLKGCHRVNANPRRDSLLKRLKETVSVGYFTRPQLMTSKAIAKRFSSAIWFLISLRPRRALLEISISIVFAIAPLIRINFGSSYYPTSSVKSLLK